MRGSRVQTCDIAQSDRTQSAGVGNQTRPGKRLVVVGFVRPVDELACVSIKVNEPAVVGPELPER